MKAKNLYVTLGVVAVLIIVFLMMGPLYIVNEGKQVVVTRFGKIVNAHTEAGLYIKVPFIDDVITYDKLILSLEGDSQSIPTKENQFIIVDTTTRWRIADPELFYQSLGSLEYAEIQLSDIIDSATRTIITQNSLSEVVRSSNLITDKGSVTTIAEETELLDAEITEVAIGQILKGRGELSIEMANEARSQVSIHGVELLDIVLRQIKYTDALTESVYNRMITDRQQVAQEFRSAGLGEQANWFGKLDREKKSIESEAYRLTQKIRGDADKEAAEIYAAAYEQDPEFYAFYKSLESYKKTIPLQDATFSTNMDYFQYLYGPNGR